jgi:uncharacterized protein (TIGR02246 family)
MNRSYRFALRCLPLFAAMLAACGGSVAGGMGTTPRTGDAMIHPSDAHEERASLEALLRRYEAALNAGDAAAAVEVYAEDAVFMAQHRAPAEGRAAIRQAYEEIFAAIRLHVAFGIDEIDIAGGTAWARTHSSGETQILAAGAKVPEKNSELFIFRKQPDGAWRIARYLFATQNPPPR